MSSGERLLQKKYGTEKKATAFYDNQFLTYLNQHMSSFIAEQEMVFISTSDRSGNCDASFRAGTAGFVRVVDNKTLLYPEYQGNGVMASLGNISENPHIGLMFIDFFDHSIGLHVNGGASILERDQLSSLALSAEKIKELNEVEGDRALQWVAIHVEEAYIHCSKHIPKLKKEEKEIRWGTDNNKYKGGDFFKAKLSNKDDNF